MDLCNMSGYVVVVLELYACIQYSMDMPHCGDDGAMRYQQDIYISQCSVELTPYSKIHTPFYTT